MKKNNTLLQQKQLLDLTDKLTHEEELKKLKSNIENQNQHLQSINEQIKNASLHVKEVEQLAQRTKEQAFAEMHEICEKKSLERDEIVAKLQRQIDNKANDYSSLIAPLELLEKEKLEKLFYCIYLTEEDKSDIMYLLTEVAPKVNHRDIVSKLVWQEFIKPALDETLKRVGVTDKPGIYKLTNLENSKCYVGKAVNVKKRIQDHFKSVVGIQSISDQAVHHEILKVGLDNWMIEQICECQKEELGEKEKFYIDFFKATDYGYNLKAGG